MITTEYCRLMARYNRWMNERLYAMALKLPHEERVRDVGAFFKSLHGTLAHIVWADRLWLARFTGQQFEAPAWGQGWIDDFDALTRRREEADAMIGDWSDRITSEWLAGVLRYRAKLDGKERSIPASVAVVHFFNHQVHHRGQVTTLLSQIGVDPGATDLLWLPGVTSAA